MSNLFPSTDISLTVYNNNVDVISYRIYQVISAISILTLMFVTIYFTIKKYHFSEHSTSKIIATFYQLTKLTHSSIAFTLTTLLLNGRYSVISSTIITLNGILTVFVIQLRLYPYLLVIDLLLKTSRIRSYGNSPASIFVTMLLVVILIFISFVIGFMIFYSFAESENFIIFFSLIIALIQLFSALITTHLYKIVKEMRRKSVFSSSLAERHAFSKNLEILTHFLPETFINFIFGCLSLLATIISVYFLKLSILTGFALSFVWFEVGSIGSTIYGFLNCHGITICFKKRDNLIKDISSTKATDVYFKTLHKMWNH